MTAMKKLFISLVSAAFLFSAPMAFSWEADTDEQDEHEEQWEEHEQEGMGGQDAYGGGQDAYGDEGEWETEEDDEQDHEW